MTAAGKPPSAGEPLPPDVVEQLLEFLLVVAWSDHAIQPQERSYFQRLLERLGANGAQLQRVIEGLRRPPGGQALEIESIPLEHRRRFLREAERVAGADGRIAPAERAILDRLRRAILRGR